MHNEFVKENSKSATAKTSKAGVPRVEGSGNGAYFQTNPSILLKTNETVFRKNEA